jgi:hypothetical protein
LEEDKMGTIIGPIAGTLAIVAVMASSTVTAGATGPGISGDGIDQDDLVGASSHVLNGQYVVQENFPPTVTSQPSGPLFGVQFSTYDRSDAVRIDYAALEGRDLL